MNKDALGERGEAIFRLLMTEFDGALSPAFRPYFLGDKWPIVDFIVELIGVANTTPYFFVQVKTTQTGYTRHKRLKVRLSEDNARLLAAYPAPTYVVGIDEQKKIGFLAFANGGSRMALSSLSTQFPMNQANRAVLWNEVKDYWASLPTSSPVSHFVDPEWR